MKSKGKDLVKIIRDNPGCVAVIDNDCWYLYREHPDNNPIDENHAVAWERWDKNNLLARDGEVKSLGDGYGSGSCYGGDVLQALAAIVGVKVESV